MAKIVQLLQTVQTHRTYAAVTTVFVPTLLLETILMNVLQVSFNEA